MLEERGRGAVLVGVARVDAALDRLLQASAADAQSKLDAIGTYLDQFVPSLADTELPAGSGGDTAAEPADLEVVGGDDYGADETGSDLGDAEPDPATSRDGPQRLDPMPRRGKDFFRGFSFQGPPVLLVPGAPWNVGPRSDPLSAA
jgi:hypothetical protein